MPADTLHDGWVLLVDPWVYSTMAGVSGSVVNHPALGSEVRGVALLAAASGDSTTASVRLAHQVQGGCAASGKVETEDRRDPQEGDLGLVLQSRSDPDQLGQEALPQRIGQNEGYRRERGALGGVLWG